MTSITIDCSGIAADDLVFDAEESENDGLLEFVTPAMTARVEYAPSGRFMHGSTAVAATWDQTAVVAVVELKAASAAALRAKKAALRAALGQFSYQVTTDEAGDVDTWAGDMGSFVPVKTTLDFNDLDYFSRLYRISIPVKPIPVA